MLIYLILLVMSVFLGTEFLAVQTPIAQLTLYRVLALLLPVVLVIELAFRRRELTWRFDQYAGYAAGADAFWWLWALLSGLWALDMKHWLQAIFLLTLGVFSVWALYLLVNRWQVWRQLATAMWLSMSGLLALGYVEILTNHYFFADMSKLDKLGTFASQPLTRIPITIFANQNDYGIMLVAYLALSVCMFYLFRTPWGKIASLGALPATFFLVLRTGSRMAVLASLIFAVIYLLTAFRWDLTHQQWWLVVILGSLAIVAAVVLVPPIARKLLSLFDQAFRGRLSGDTVRLNLMREGLVFLAETFGLGVGAGNIEVWMERYRELRTNGIVNIHHWWLEILVGYGIPVFLAYTSAYLFLLYRLLVRRLTLAGPKRAIACSLAAFMVAFIPASTTSANNLLIEWHWVFFGLLIAFVKLLEQDERQHKRQKGRLEREQDEFIHIIE